jgi:SNF2 family DNA or RNA helicase
MLKPFEHQKTTSKFIIDNPRVLVTSDPGTGKTRSVIDAYLARSKGRMLVLAPLSILQASWGDDIDKFAPGIEYEVAFARNRAKAFKSQAEIIITNHDAVKWLAKNTDVLDGFNTLCIDEFTAFKNKDSQRSKAVHKIAQLFDYRIAMSGTPNSNTICDIWHPTLLVDDGHRLGHRFYTFRANVCTPVFNGFANEWKDKPDAELMVAAAIKDINIRYELEECLDMPEQSYHTIKTQLSDTMMQAYKALAEDNVLWTGEATINAVHAGALTKKLLQLCTGAVYNEDGEVVGFHQERYNLVMDLVDQRKHTLVAFNWTHERDYLIEQAEKRGIKYGVIDGSISAKARKDVVDRLQAGQLQVVFAHPQSAGHGLTLTTATSVIWCSPTYNAEHYQQFNRRIYRAGQTKRTEVIHIAAEDTWETDVYEKLSGKLGRMENLLNILKVLNPTKEKAA